MIHSTTSKPFQYPSEKSQINRSLPSRSPSTPPTTPKPIRFGEKAASKGLYSQLKDTLVRWWKNFLSFLGISSKQKPSTTTKADPLVRAQLEEQLKKREGTLEEHLKRLDDAQMALSKLIEPEQPIDSKLLKEHSAKVSEAAKVFFEEHQNQKQLVDKLEKDHGLDLKMTKLDLALFEKHYSEYNQPPEAIEALALVESDVLKKTIKELQIAKKILMDRVEKGEIEPVI